MSIPDCVLTSGLALIAPSETSPTRHMGARIVCFSRAAGQRDFPTDALRCLSRASHSRTKEDLCSCGSPRNGVAGIAGRTAGKWQPIALALGRRSRAVMSETRWLPARLHGLVCIRRCSCLQVPESSAAALAGGLARLGFGVRMSREDATKIVPSWPTTRMRSTLIGHGLAHSGSERKKLASGQPSLSRCFQSPV